MKKIKNRHQVLMRGVVKKILIQMKVMTSSDLILNLKIKKSILHLKNRLEIQIKIVKRM